MSEQQVIDPKEWESPAEWGARIDRQAQSIHRWLKSGELPKWYNGQRVWRKFKNRYWIHVVNADAWWRNDCSTTFPDDESAA